MRFYPAVAICAFTAIPATPASLAEDAAAALPIYPNTNHGGTAREPVNDKIVSQAVIQGSTATLYTADSPETVDRWYQSRLPKSCTRTAITETMFQYKCASRWVTITPHQGQTQIILSPEL